MAIFLDTLHEKNIKKLQDILDPKELTYFLESFFAFLGSSILEGGEVEIVLTFDMLDSFNPENRQVILNALCLATPADALADIALSCESKDNIIHTIFQYNPYEHPSDSFFVEFIHCLSKRTDSDVNNSLIWKEVYLKACPRRLEKMIKIIDLSQWTGNIVKLQKKEHFNLEQILHFTEFVDININGINREIGLFNLLNLIEEMLKDRKYIYDFVENIQGLTELLKFQDHPLAKQILFLALACCKKSEIEHLKKFFRQAENLPEALWKLSIWKNLEDVLINIDYLKSNKILSQDKVLLIENLSNEKKLV